MTLTIEDADVDYALNIVKTICDEIGPGLPGTPQELERASIIRKELEASLGAEAVVVEEFSLAPRAFVGSLPVSAVLMTMASVLSIAAGRVVNVPPWLMVVASLTCSIMSILLVVLEFILGREFIDALFPKKRSINVIGRLRGTGDVKRLLILSGHHDSAPENTWFGLLGRGFLVASPTWFLGLLVMPVLGFVQLVGVIIGNSSLLALGVPGWLLMVYPVLPAIIYGWFFNRGWKGGGTVPGAADNLSACAVVLTVCRWLINNPSQIPPGTEIRLISFGCEEAGYRGSRRYVERHLDELRRLDVRTLNLETIADREMGILSSDVSNTVKNHPEMLRSLVSAAERAEVPHRVKPAVPGAANDSGPFSWSNLKAATVVAFRMPEQMLAFYHQPQDTPEVLTREPLQNAIKLSLEWVRCGGE